MNWEMTLLVERNKGHDEGHAEGLAEGLAEGRAEGLTDGEILKLVKLVRKKLSLHQSEEKIPLGTEEWTCPVCGIHHLRDYNSARNVLQRGLAVKALQI